MEFWVKLLEFINTEMDTPQMYGAFHLIGFALSIISGILLCIFIKKPDEKFMRKFLLGVFLAVLVFEAYRQIHYWFYIEDGVIKQDYQWYIFPFQFCSSPMYAGILAGIMKNKKVHDALCAYLASFSLFAALCVMFYPADIFTDAIGINVQTVFSHGSMITVAIFLLYTGYVKAEHKTILKAIPVFAFFVVCAMIMNEIAYFSGLLETDTFNMFYISPHCDPSLPVYSMVQENVAYPWCLIIYIAAFSLAAYLLILIAMLFKKIFSKKGFGIRNKNTAFFTCSIFIFSSGYAYIPLELFL